MAEAMYARYWDHYVESWYERDGDESLEWPGDEWGSPGGWEGLYRKLLVPAGVAGWRRAVEIGPGSGKYTLKVLADSAAVVRGYDVSRRFLDVCAQRCAAELESGRLSLQLLDSTRADALHADLVAAGWEGTVDAVYSIDAMVHVDLQYLIAYLLTAALVLRPGGKLVLTLADATTERGFEKLLRDVAPSFRAAAQSIGSGKFEWLAPDLVRTTLERLGFELELLGDDGRDLHVIAALARPEVAAGLAGALASAEEAERARAAARVRAVVEAAVPAGARVALVSYGDENLVALAGREGWHYPTEGDGTWAGYYPADGVEAVDQLEAVRALGVVFLVVPADSAWWLDHYLELREHLQERYDRLAVDDEACAIFDLRAPRPRSARERAELAYWTARQREEGVLGNDHFAAFYTGFFGLEQDFYRGKRILDVGCGPRGSLEWAVGALAMNGLPAHARRVRT